MSFDDSYNDFCSALFNGESVPSILNISDMVAFPVFDSRTTTPTLPAGTVATSTKLIPRRGVTDVWLDELNDLLSSRKLTQITHEQQPATFQDVSAKLPGVPAHIVQAVHIAIAQQWWAEATSLYQIIRASVDLSGIFEKKDLLMIKSAYVDGDLRNGPAFLKWAMSFTNASSVDSQTRLIKKVLEAKLPSNPTQEQFAQHVSNLLIDWVNIKGNDVRYPASFYHTLLKSLPDADTGKVGHLRSWLVDTISDDSPVLREPSDFVEHFISRAEKLGLPSSSGGSVNALLDNCQFCPSRVCKSSKTWRDCLALNSKLPRPSHVQDGPWSFIELMRAYCAAFPGTRTLKKMTVAKMHTALEEAGKPIPPSPNTQSGGEKAAANLVLILNAVFSLLLPT